MRSTLLALCRRGRNIMSSLDERTTPNYLTGVAALDAQHQELHGLIRELAAFPKESVLSMRTQRVLRDVWRYSFDHFRDEERVMVERGILPIDFGSHVADHARCLNYLSTLWSAQHKNVRAAPDSGEVHRKLAEFWQQHIVEYDLAIASLRGAPVDHGHW